MKRWLGLFCACAMINPVPPAYSAGTPAKKEESPEKKKLEELATENNILKQEAAKKLQPMADRKEEMRLKREILEEASKIEFFDKEKEQKSLALEESLSKLRFQEKLRQMAMEKDELQIRNMLDAERQKRELWELQAEQQKTEMEYRLAEARQKKELSDVKHLLETITVKNNVEREKLKEAEMKYQEEKNQIDLEMKRLSLRQFKMKFDQEAKANDIAMLKSEIGMREERERWRQEANREPLYLASPYENGRLTVSDRRIPLNGPIVRGTADYVMERIHYFNNEDQSRPIFLVMDSSPGGSVMEGYRIIKAMEESSAPVHVVVKSYAASMAALILAMAKESYAYPNAVILHHEISGVNWGNMTQLKEQLEIAKEWERRLYGPVSKKIGLNLEEFRKEMYKHNSDGDWEEFGDSAQKLKWVKYVVSEIRETGYVKRPAEDKKPESRWPFPSASVERVDEKGRRYVSLPRLIPYDMYYIHNPDDYYR